MKASCYTRPNKPMITAKPVINIRLPNLDSSSLPKLLEVDSSTECHVTPSSVAARMVDYLDYQKATIEQAGMSVIEPHGGTGQLIKAMLSCGILGSHILTIEKNCKLAEQLQGAFPGKFVKVHQGDCFDPYFDFCIEVFDRAIANPPFKKVVAHIDRLMGFLKVGGIAVCLVPTTYKKLDHEVLEELPADTFPLCQVRTKIIRLTKGN